MLLLTRSRGFFRRVSRKDAKAQRVMEDQPRSCTEVTQSYTEE